VSRYRFQNLFIHEIHSWGHQVSNATNGKLSLGNVRLRMRSRFALVLHEMVRVVNSPALRSSTSTSTSMKNTETLSPPTADVHLKRAKPMKLCRYQWACPLAVSYSGIILLPPFFCLSCTAYRVQVASKQKDKGVVAWASGLGKGKRMGASEWESGYENLRLDGAIPCRHALANGSTDRGLSFALPNRLDNRCAGNHFQMRCWMRRRVGQYLRRGEVV
jgi:hypothetical protein